LRPVGFVIITALAIGIGVLGILRPVVLVRWAKGAHPDLPEDNEGVLWLVRFIGMIQLAIGLRCLVIIVWSF
jgi:hypothetical protein